MSVLLQSRAYKATVSQESIFYIFGFTYSLVTEPLEFLTFARFFKSYFADLLFTPLRGFLPI